MPPVIFAIMLTIERCGGLASIYDIEDGSGYGGAYILTLMYGIRDRGWMPRRCYLRRYELTERGKIALAIEVGRQTKARAAGMKRNLSLAKAFWPPCKVRLWT